MELYAACAVFDLSAYSLAIGGAAAAAFTFPADSAAAGSFVHVSADAQGEGSSGAFEASLGFPPTYASALGLGALDGAAGVQAAGGTSEGNYSEAVELRLEGAAVDGAGMGLSFAGGWAYRVAGAEAAGGSGAAATFGGSDPSAW